jgi:hypothetical protein
MPLKWNKFFLCIRNMRWRLQLQILELAEEHRSISQMKFTIVPAFNKPDHLQTCWFYKGYLEGILRSFVVFLPWNSRASHLQNGYHQITL